MYTYIYIYIYTFVYICVYEYICVYVSVCIILYIAVPNYHHDSFMTTGAFRTNLYLTSWVPSV